MLAQLDTKTNHQFMDSLLTIDDYIQRSKEYGYTEIAIMNKDHLHGTYEFYKKAKEVGLKPLIGMEVTLLYKKGKLSIRLLALSDKGYSDLGKVALRRSQNKEVWEDFEDLFSDLAVIISYYEGIEDLDLKGFYFIGIPPKGVNVEVISKLNHPVIPLYFVNSLDKKDKVVLQALKAVKEGCFYQEAEDLVEQGILLTHDQLMRAYRLFPEAIENLTKLTSSISYTIDKVGTLPSFSSDIAADKLLLEKSVTGLIHRGVKGNDYQKRLKMELDVISKKGFSNYFLIVSDVVQYARSLDCYMGMGRGSAVGSLVAYALGITGIDPIKNHLLFERFLNEDREDMPDIDIDIPHIVKPIVLFYLQRKYGYRNVAQFTTFSTFGAKQALIDVFKRFGIKDGALDLLLDSVGYKMSLEESYQKSPRFKEIIDGNPFYKKLLKIAYKIEGLYRQPSIHASGVVINQNSLIGEVPLKMGEASFISQYSVEEMESLGFLKFDLLSLKNLTFLQQMKELLFERHGKQLNLDTIPLDDVKTLQLFQKGYTKGVFQFEGEKAKNLLKQLKPSSFEDIVIATALNRPGASLYADGFLSREEGIFSSIFSDETAKEIFESTHGYLIFQEQVMIVVRLMTKCSLSKADVFRRYITKKDKEKIKVLKQWFIEAAVSNGYDLETVKKTYEAIEQFAEYGFNRSHAYAYSVLSFQLAYFKAHYPDVFYDVFRFVYGIECAKDAQQIGYQVALSSVQKIPFYSTFKNNVYYIGLHEISSIPFAFSNWLMGNRPFVNLEDFLGRLPLGLVGEGLLLHLVLSGMLNDLEEDKHQLLNKIHQYLLLQGYEGVDAFFKDYNRLDYYQAKREFLKIGVGEHPLAGKVIDAKKKPKRKTNKLVQLEVLSIHFVKTKKNSEMAFLKATNGEKEFELIVFPEEYKKCKKKLKEGRCYLVELSLQKKYHQTQFILKEVLEEITF